MSIHGGNTYDYDNIEQDFSANLSPLGMPEAVKLAIQKAVEVKTGDTPEILQKRVMEQAEWKILPKAVSLFCEDKIKVIGNKTEISE